MIPHGAVRFVFGLVGDANELLLFLALMITFKKIISSKSTQDFSGVPYVITLLNCFVNAWYGVVTPDDILVFTLNAAGATLELTYVLIFLVLAPKRETVKTFSILTLVLSLLGMVALISKLVFHQSDPRSIFCAMMVGDLMIFTQRLVIRTKNTEFMPFFLSLFVFLCGICWFVFGLLGNDHFLALSTIANSHF